MTDISALLRQAFQSIAKLKQRHPVAACIQYPKLPSLLSESLVVNCGSVLFPNAKNIRLGGGRERDILFGSPKGTMTVEVKATGRSAFQSFGQKDIRADFLVWIAFGAAFEKKDGDPIRVYLLPKPGKIFDRPRKITLAQFKKEAGGKLSCYQGILADLINGKLKPVSTLQGIVRQT
jgi:hypothetical protein